MVNEVLQGKEVVARLINIQYIQILSLEAVVRDT